MSSRRQMQIQTRKPNTLKLILTGAVGLIYYYIDKLTLPMSAEEYLKKEEKLRRKTKKEKEIFRKKYIELCIEDMKTVLKYYNKAVVNKTLLDGFIYGVSEGDIPKDYINKNDLIIFIWPHQRRPNRHDIYHVFKKQHNLANEYEKFYNNIQYLTPKKAADIVMDFTDTKW